MFELMFLVVMMVLAVELAYIIGRGDVLTPGFILAASFLFSALMALVGNKHWGASVSIESVIMISAGVYAFEIGSISSRNYIFKLPHRTDEQKSGGREISIRTSHMVLLLAIELIALFIYYKKVTAIAVRVGYSGTKLIQFVRVGLAVLNLKIGFVGALAASVFVPAALISVYAIVGNLIRKERRFVKYYLGNILSIIICLFGILLSGARVGMILILYSFVVILLFCMRQSKTKSISIVKTLKYIIMATGILFLTFTFMGTFTGKTIAGEEINNFFMYGGGGIPAFSEWFADRKIQYDNLGKQSFNGAYQLLDKIFPGIAQGVSSGIALVTFPDGTKTNVFTGFRVYLFEYGIIGTIILMMILGTIYTAIYNSVKTYPSVFRIILYAYLSRDVFYLIFTPAPTSNLFSVTQILSVFWMIIIGYLLFGKKYFSDHIFSLDKR